MPSPPPAPKDHYKVRVVTGDVTLHLASWTEPHCGPPGQVEADWINDPAYGETIGYIDWTTVNAITWRFHAGADT